jgi:hypothetical protein
MHANRHNASKLEQACIHVLAVNYYATLLELRSKFTEVEKVI